MGWYQKRHSPTHTWNVLWESDIILDFMRCGEDNRGKCTDNPAGCHPIRTIDAPTSIIRPIIALCIPWKCSAELKETPSLLHPLIRKRSSVISMFVCLFVCMHISWTTFPNFTKFFRHGLVLLRWRCNKLRNSSFVYDIIIGYNGHKKATWKLRHAYTENDSST